MSRASSTRASLRSAARLSRLAVLVLVAFLLATPLVAAAAPVDGGSEGSAWSLIWQDWAAQIASWFGWGEPSAVTGESELGSTLDPDGFTNVPDDGTTVLSVEPHELDRPAGELGSTLDPDG